MAQIRTNTTDLQTILNTVKSLPSAGSGSGDVQTVEQATPTITISSSGLITASATQGEGYVSAGTKSATKQMNTKAESTVMPKTTEQTIMVAGTYATGTQKVAGDANLVSGNIKSGVTIFDVTGTYEGSGSTGGATSGSVVKAAAVSNLTVASGYSAVTLTYGSEVVNSSGTVSLGGTTGSVSVSSASALDVAKGKYLKLSGTNGAIYYIPADATFTQGGSTYSKKYTVSTANQMFVLA